MPERNSHEPLYAKIERLLVERIRTKHRAGDLIPTQQQLAKEAGVSLITVKRALAELGRRGLIESVRGRGTVVRRVHINDNHAGISSWTNSMTGLGEEPHTEWLPAEIARDPWGFVLTGRDLASDGERPPRWSSERAPLFLETSVPGIFAAGDVRHRSVKRVSSAVGDGAIAIALVHEYLAA